ncbi:hypothetical protein [Streptomyces prunicolor]
MSRAFRDDRAELPVAAQLAGGLPVVGAGRGRRGLAEPLGAVGVQEVLAG